jgi:hypothetical protein
MTESVGSYYGMGDYGDELYSWKLADEIGGETGEGWVPVYLKGIDWIPIGIYDKGPGVPVFEATPVG